MEVKRGDDGRERERERALGVCGEEGGPSKRSRGIKGGFDREKRKTKDSPVFLNDFGGIRRDL